MKATPKYLIILFSLIVLGVCCEENPVTFRRLVYSDYTVSYSVHGSMGTATIQLTDADGTMKTFREAALPFTYTFTKSNNFYASLIAFASGTTGRIDASIFVENSLFLTDTSETGNPISRVGGMIYGSNFTAIIEESYDSGK